MTDYDPMEPASDEIDATFADLRANCPVHHHALPQSDVDRINANPLVARPTSEFWSVFGYDDVVAILQDSQHFSSAEGPGPERLVPLNDDGMLLFADEPAHIRQRRIAAKAFTPRSVELLTPKIQQVVDDLIDGLADRGRADVMADFSVPLTIQMIAGMLGVDEDRADDLRRWGNDTVAAFGGGPEAAAEGLVAMQELFGLLGPMISDRRTTLAKGGEPPDDILSALVAAEYQGSGFSDDEVLMACQQLLTAGFETTSTAIGNAVVLLCSHADQRALLEADPDLLDGAIEEILRFMAPIEGLFRSTTEDIDIAGVKIPTGAKVRCVFASANRDATQFDDADQLRIDRDPHEIRKHLSFGLGAHACLGASLARGELRVALSTLLQRLPGLMLDPESSPIRNEAQLINGYSHVPIVWDPAEALGRTA